MKQRRGSSLTRRKLNDVKRKHRRLFLARDIARAVVIVSILATVALSIYWKFYGTGPGPDIKRYVPGPIKDRIWGVESGSSLDESLHSWGVIDYIYLCIISAFACASLVYGGTVALEYWRNRVGVDETPNGEGEEPGGEFMGGLPWVNKVKKYTIPSYIGELFDPSGLDEHPEVKKAGSDQVKRAEIMDRLYRIGIENKLRETLEEKLAQVDDFPEKVEHEDPDAWEKMNGRRYDNFMAAFDAYVGHRVERLKNGKERTILSDDHPDRGDIVRLAKAFKDAVDNKLWVDPDRARGGAREDTLTLPEAVESLKLILDQSGINEYQRIQFTQKLHMAGHFDAMNARDAAAEEQAGL